MSDVSSFFLLLLNFYSIALISNISMYLIVWMCFFLFVFYYFFFGKINIFKRRKRTENRKQNKSIEKDFQWQTLKEK